MSINRKFRRANRGEPLPPAWDGVAAKATERTKAAMDAAVKLLPGRGVILISAPGGTSSEDVEAIACCTNFSGDRGESRQMSAQIFQSLLEYWGPDVMLVQPDRQCTRALREGVAAIRDVPVGAILKEMPNTLAHLADTFHNAARAMAAGDLAGGRVIRQAITHHALQLAVESLALFDRLNPAAQQTEDSGPHPSGAPDRAPMPPPRQWPKGDTKETLVADLLERPPTEERDQIIAMARAGKFHDFESDDHAPKSMLVDVLQRFGYPDLAGKARDGGYDDEPMTVTQAEELRHDVGPETFDAMIPPGPGKRGQA